MFVCITSPGEEIFAGNIVLREPFFSADRAKTRKNRVKIRATRGRDIDIQVCLFLPELFFFPKRAQKKKKKTAKISKVSPQKVRATRYTDIQVCSG